MALDSRAHRHSHINNDTSTFYAFGGSSSSAAHHQTTDLPEGELSLSRVGFHKLTSNNNNNNNNFLKLHQLGHMMHGGSGGKVLSDSNDGSSLISFEDSTDAAAGVVHGYENDSDQCFNNSHQTASSFETHLLSVDDTNPMKGNVRHKDGAMLEWFNYPSDAADHGHTAEVHKQQPITDVDGSYMPPTKKQCTSTSRPKKSKQAKPVMVSKDPQSIAAKNRRERISERLKILQELVPNGTKVDLVTMLEKAIGYVKFLQLQVKVLAADEFWPVQGGKAPELSQVKDAIDAILSSQRSDRNSSI